MSIVFFFLLEIMPFKGSKTWWLVGCMAFILWMNYKAVIYLFFLITYLSCNQQFEVNVLVPYQLQNIGSRVSCHRIIFENFINLKVREKENLTAHQKKKMEEERN